MVNNNHFYYVKMFDYLSLKDLVKDGLHLNPKSHEKVYKRVLKVILKLLNN